MADTETKSKAEKEPQKSDKAPRPEKGDKAQQAQKGPKPEKGDKAAKGEAPPPKPRRREERVTPRLKTYFEDVVRKKLFDELGYKSRLQVPVIEKVVINMGIGEGVADRRKVEAAANDLGLIAGQKAVITKARKSIATFKVRDGQPIGCKVTLRKARMYEFVDRLINIARARFSRLVAEELRRRGELHDRHQGAHHLSRDRLRQGRRRLGDGHYRVHQRENRQRGASAAERVQLPVPAVSSSAAPDSQETLMAKKSSIEKNNRRRKLSKKYSGRRARLRAIARDKTKPMEERFAATLKLAELPRNSSATRIRNRCEVSGRPRGYYRKHRLSRIALRDLGSKGLIPGLVKSSW
jgi:ribosomal protein S14